MGRRLVEHDDVVGEVAVRGGVGPKRGIVGLVGGPQHALALHQNPASGSGRRSDPPYRVVTFVPQELEAIAQIAVPVEIRALL